MLHAGARANVRHAERSARLRSPEGARRGAAGGPVAAILRGLPGRWAQVGRISLPPARQRLATAARPQAHVLPSK